MNTVPTYARLKYWEEQAKYPMPDCLFDINVNDLPYRTWLWFVCQDYGAKVAVEVGVEQGRTTAALAAAVSDMAIGIEKHLRADWMEETLGRMPEEHRPKVRIVEGDSIAPETVARVREELGGRMIDLLYLDGIHSVEYVGKELKAYGPMLSAVSLVACDDLHQPASLGAWFRELPGIYVGLDWLHMLHGHWGPPGQSCGFGALIVAGEGRERLWA